MQAEFRESAVKVPELFTSIPYTRASICYAAYVSRTNRRDFIDRFHGQPGYSVDTVVRVSNKKFEKYPPSYLWWHSTTEFSDGFATQSVYHQTVRLTCPVYHRYPYGPFAEYSKECIRGNRRGRLTNVCVVGISSGNKEKNPLDFEQKIYSVSNGEMQRV